MMLSNSLSIFGWVSPIRRHKNLILLFRYILNGKPRVNKKRNRFILLIQFETIRWIFPHFGTIFHAFISYFYEYPLVQKKRKKKIGISDSLFPFLVLSTHKIMENREGRKNYGNGTRMLNMVNDIHTYYAKVVHFRWWCTLVFPQLDIHFYPCLY